MLGRTICGCSYECQGDVQITSNENVIVVSAGVLKSPLNVQRSYFTETIFHISARNSISFINIEEFILF